MLFQACIYNKMFQHTAARRRLQQSIMLNVLIKAVSTHSRPKAAAANISLKAFISSCFNTQPPEGGCYVVLYPL